MIDVTVNGERREVPAECSAARLLEILGAQPRTVAVAINGTVIRRADLASTALVEGSTVEIVRAVGGG